MTARLSAAYRSIEAWSMAHGSRAPVSLLALLFTMVDLRREAAAVTTGRALSRSTDPRATLTALRRNVHRLEKGLVMRPRRVPFGAGFIGDTVDQLDRLLTSGDVPADDLAWATGVLHAYFEAVPTSEVPAIEDARRQLATLGLLPCEPSFSPAPRSVAPALTVSVDGLEALTTRRRSVRWFGPEAVDPRAVDRALVIGAQAPSACNRQNIRFHVVYGTDATTPFLDTVGGTKGFSHQVPCVVVVIGSLAGYRNTFDRHAIFVDGGLASMGFILALETLGLSSCCINWPDVKSRYASMRRLVPIADDEQIIMLIAVGHADPEGLVPSSRKRGLDRLRSTVEPSRSDGERGV